MYGETGQVCKNKGNYKCFGHPENVITLQPGDVFPKCSYEAPHDALWIRIREKVPVKKASQDDR